jgi:uncharacterized protein (TIGR03435 family)
MIPFPVVADLAKTCTEVAPAVANHLWQSTIFAAVAGALTLALRSNQARARYWLWMAASLKFLLPFSLLMCVGGMMARPRATAVAAQPSVYLAMEEVSQPFEQPMGPVAQAAAPDARARIAELAPAMVAAVWAIGFGAVLSVWVMRWRRVARAMRDAEPMDEGREAEALRRLEQAGGVRAPIRMLLSPGAMEPGVFGLGIGRARTVLAWPAGISARLDDAHLEAVLAHEVAHVRRRDNLTAAIHMLVEAIFWFHPLVWWLGARLLAERERACDEEVVQLCGRPAVYAEGILKVCEYCVESPLACVSGVTGADLKQRIMQIMTARVARRIGVGRKLLLLGAGMVVVAVPVLAGRSKAMREISSLALAPPPSMMPAFLTGGDAQANAPAGEAVRPDAQDAAAPEPAAATDAAYALGPEFEVATIRPTDPKRHGGGSYVSSSGRFEGQNTTLRGLVHFAYGSFPHPSGDDASGGPDWAGSEHFDVEAKVDDAQMANWSKMSDSQRIDLVKPMLRRLLVERFQLKLHTETHVKEVFALVQAKGGAKLKEVAPPPPINDEEALQQSVRDSMAQKSPKPVAGSFMMGRDGWVGNSIPIEMLLNEIAANVHLGAPLVDQTGLKGYYDFAMKVLYGEDAPLLTDQIETQLGLKVELRKLPLKTYVIDAAEKPSVDGAEVQEPPTLTPTPPSVAPQPPAPAFEVATIKPNDPSSHGGATAWMQTSPDELKMMGSLKTFLKLAYGFEDVQIAGGPGWLDSDLFEIDAKASSPFADPAEVKLMLRDLLNKRFALSTHTETKPLPVYSLIVAKDGPKLQRADESGPRGSSSGPTLVRGTLDTGQLAHMLTPILGRTVIDNTGLHGSYKVDLTWAADDQTSGPSLFTAIQEQLGLKLEPTKGPVETLVIDHAEKPSEN